MLPTVLALVDSVLTLAFHHDARGKRSSSLEHAHIAVWATIEAPHGGPDEPRRMRVEVVIQLTPRSEEREICEQRRDFVIDLANERILAPSLALAELGLGRSAHARVIAELETWCYQTIPDVPPGLELLPDDISA